MKFSRYLVIVEIVKIIYWIGHVSYKSQDMENDFFMKRNSVLMLLLYKVSLFLLGRLHFFLHFFLAFLWNRRYLLVSTHAQTRKIHPLSAHSVDEMKNVFSWHSGWRMTRVTNSKWRRSVEIDDDDAPFSLPPACSRATERASRWNGKSERAVWRGRVRGRAKSVRKM